MEYLTAGDVVEVLRVGTARGNGAVEFGLWWGAVLRVRERRI
jgi:hypothetical protein